MITIFFTLCVIILGKADATQEELCPINFCNHTVSGGEVETFCKRNETREMNGRCCIYGDTIIGLDLRSCGLNKLNITSKKLINITILDLQENDIAEVTKDELIGFLELNSLYLPQNIPCPGDKHAWGNVSQSDNVTSCFFQQNPCQYLNVSCTENGECIHTGPGSAKCICLPGHYGYKCMNEGEFPDTAFFTSVTVCTVILCVALWFMFGKDSAKKS